MKNQSLILALAQIRADIQNGDKRQALLNLAKLETCVKNCDCSELAEPNYPEIMDDLPAMLRVQAGLPLEAFEV